MYAEGTYAEGDYADGSYVYDEQGNPIGVMPGTAMAEAFQEAGFYEGGYGPRDSRARSRRRKPAQDTAAAERPGGGRRHPREHRRGPEAQERQRIGGPARPVRRRHVGRSADPRGAPEMLLVGLTGGIASGKSTVSAMLAERGPR